MRRLGQRGVRAAWVAWGAALALCLAWNFCNLTRASKSRDQPYIWGWDNNFYFAWARSLALDGDIDFANDYQFIAHWRGGGSTQSDFADYLKRDPKTPLGRVPNITGIGYGLAAVPALWVARGASAVHASATGAVVSPFAAVYCLAFIFTSILLGFAGLAVTYGIMMGKFGERTALWAMVAGTLGLSTGYYIWFDPTMAQSAEFGFSAIYLASVLRWERALQAGAAQRRGLWVSALAMGVMLGVCCMTHFTAVALVAAPFVIGARYLFAGMKKKDFEIAARPLGGSLGCAALGSLMGFGPQLLAWKLLYGAWWVNTYEVAFHWWPWDFFRVFFDGRIGLFVWTPLAGLAIAGLVMAARRGEALAKAGCGVLLAFVWEFSTCDLFAPGATGSAFGMRYLVDGSIFFFIGLAALFEWLRRRPGCPMVQRIVMALVLLLVVWNLYLTVCYRAQIQPHGAPLAGEKLFADEKAWGRQLRSDIALYGRLFGNHFPLFTPMNNTP